MISRFRTFTFTLAPSLLFLSANVWAADCSSNADCDAGFACEKAQWVESCAAPDMKGTPSDCDTTVHEAETGSCVKQPVACDSNADCDEYLSCVAAPSGGACTASPDGTETCVEPTEASKYCSIGTTECTSNADCPREFECAAMEVGCAVPADCGDKDCTCDPSTVHQCQPKKIECDVDSACPTDWRCFNNTVTTCSGGSGTSGSSGGIAMGGASSTGSGGTPAPTPGAPDPMPGGSKPAPDASEPAPDAPEPGMMAGGASGTDPVGSVDPREDPTCTTVPSVGTCMPSAWLDFGFDASATGGGEASGIGAEPPLEDVPEKGADDDGLLDGPTAAAHDPAETPVSGGCTTSPNAPARAAWGLVGLFLLAPLMRRRSVNGRVRA